jgi:hypothetical protein
MNRLNYFNNYQSKSEYHEDQLTRSYLVLLRHSFHCFSLFFDYVRKKHILTDFESPLALTDLITSGWTFATQKGNPRISTNFLLSIVITDTAFESKNQEVEKSERSAVYDGIISFGSELTMIIENKPRSENVWFGQLSPSLSNLSEETNIYTNAVVLEWKEIIKHLNSVLTLETLSGYDRIMIEDFLEFIDDKFPFLNPFDSFHLCKGNVELLNRRVFNILKEIAIDENLVQYHKNWGHYIKTSFKQIQQVGLIIGTDEKTWWLELSLYFGDSQIQAQSFYRSNPDFSKLKTGYYRPNFHVSFASSNLVWFHSPDKKKFVDFWVKNVSEIYQHSKKDIPTFLKKLEKNKVIQIDSVTDENLKKKFYDTEMQTLNICPGIGVVFEFDSITAEKLDLNGEFVKTLKDKIQEGLSIINIDSSLLIK